MGRRTKIRKWMRKIPRTILQIAIKNSQFESLRIRYIYSLTWFDLDLTSYLVRKLEFFDTRFENKIAVKLLEEMLTNGMNLTELNMTNFFMFFHHLMAPQRETFDWVLFSRINNVVHLNYGVQTNFHREFFFPNDFTCKLFEPHQRLDHNMLDTQVGFHNDYFTVL